MMNVEDFKNAIETSYQANADEMMRTIEKWVDFEYLCKKAGYRIEVRSYNPEDYIVVNQEDNTHLISGSRRELVHNFLRD